MALKLGSTNYSLHPVASVWVKFTARRVWLIFVQLVIEAENPNSVPLSAKVPSINITLVGLQLIAAHQMLSLLMVYHEVHRWHQVRCWQSTRSALFRHGPGRQSIVNSTHQTDKVVKLQRSSVQVEPNRSKVLSVQEDQLNLRCFRLCANCAEGWIHRGATASGNVASV